MDNFQFETKKEYDVVQQRPNPTDEEIRAELDIAKKLSYESVIVSKIRKKYNVNQELAILRQKDTKLDEYYEYFDYVEQCKEEAKNEYLRN